MTELVPLSQIFDVSYGNKLDLNKMRVCLTDPHINFVSRTGKNNGVSATVERLPNIEPYEEGLLTVALGGSTLSSFVQNDKFYTAQNVAVLRPLGKLSLQEKLFYCMCIKKNAYRYTACGREANRTLRELAIPSKEGTPSWVNAFDISAYEKANEPLVKGGFKELSTISWKWFNYEQLFSIERGKGPRKKDLDGTGNTPFVTSSDSNNGWTGMTTSQPTHLGNTIGVNRNGSVAEAFYQPIPYCSTEDVHIFTPKFRMDRYSGLFLATLIRREKYRFNYGRKWGIARMQKTQIKLPVIPEGTPDFGYMEEYIKHLPYSSSV